jgi:hypothetical protein
MLQNPETRNKTKNQAMSKCLRKVAGAQDVLIFHCFRMAVQFVVRIRGEALGSPTGKVKSQRFSVRRTSAPVMLARSALQKSPSKSCPTIFSAIPNCGNGSAACRGRDRLHPSRRLRRVRRFRKDPSVCRQREAWPPNGRRLYLLGQARRVACALSLTARTSQIPAG